jgi:hypothetical protein
LLDLIHTNIYGPITIHIIGRYTYFITFIDDHFRYGYVYLIKKILNQSKGSKNSKVKLKNKLERLLWYFN